MMGGNNQTPVGYAKKSPLQERKRAERFNKVTQLFGFLEHSFLISFIKF